MTSAAGDDNNNPVSTSIVCSNNNGSNNSCGPYNELALVNLLSKNNTDVAILTEVELGEDWTDFAVARYSTCLPPPPADGKYSVVALVKNAIAPSSRARKDLTISETSIWLETSLGRHHCHPLIIGGFYRPWGDLPGEKLLMELMDKVKVTTTTADVLLTGDLNLDAKRLDYRSSRLTWTGSAPSPPPSMNSTRTGPRRRPSRWPMASGTERCNGESALVLRPLITLLPSTLWTPTSGLSDC